MENVRTATLDGIQKKQIEDWLKEADRHIREGRYIAADELLQKILTPYPGNTTARAFHDRIQFLVGQLAQRVGLEDDMYKEIKKYREITSKRKNTQINSFLNSAQQYLNEGNFKKASDQANKAHALEPGNTFAKALLHRITELQTIPGTTSADTEREFKFSSLLKEGWRNGKPSAQQEEMIKNKQVEYRITDLKRREFEEKIRNALYKESIHDIWLTGGLAAFTSRAVDTLRKRFEISRIDYSVIESALLKEFRKNKIRGTVLLADEDDGLLLDLSSVLRSNFFGVIAAGNLEEALASLKITIPHIIISEVNFQNSPGGFDLFEAIRSSPHLKHIPFIFTSRHIDRTTLLIGKRLGVDEFLTKPIDTELLIEILNGKLRIKSPKPESK